jgi:type VI secretion system protein ImpH
MAGARRRASVAVRPHSAYVRLLREPQRFGFDAAMRVLMRVSRRDDPADAARFRSPPGLAFPPADITEIAPPDAGRPAQVTIGLMGLAGPSGVLPRHYTEVLTTQQRSRSRAMADFLDMLAHRHIAQFGRAGIKYRVHRAADAALDAGASAKPDQVVAALLALTGYGTPHLTPRLNAGTEPLLHYAGLFAMRPRSADRLQALASDWLGRRVEVVQFAGSWLHLARDQRTALPRGRLPGAWNRLGIDAAIGVRAWDIQARVVLRVGPLDRAAFEALLPGRAALGRFVSLVRAYLGFETGFAVNPVLAGPALTPLRLGGADPTPLLGWNTWIPSPGPRPPIERDRSDAVFEAERVESARPCGGQA